MVIREINREECLQFLAGAKLARLACAHENQPYVVPVTLAYHKLSCGEPCLYGFTTPGQKVAWMRANPLVCIEVEEVTDLEQWVSVIAFGRYEELSDVAEQNGERLFAQELLQEQGMWWEPASSGRACRIHHDSAEPFIPIFYRIRINQCTGRKATRDFRQEIPYTLAAPLADRLGRLGQSTFARVWWLVKGCWRTDTRWRLNPVLKGLGERP